VISFAFAALLCTASYHSQPPRVSAPFETPDGNSQGAQLFNFHSQSSPQQVPFFHVKKDKYATQHPFVIHW